MRINGRKVGQFAEANQKAFELKVPASALGNESVARLEWRCQAWKPSEHSGGKDARPLGIAVRQIEWLRAGAEQTPAASAALTFPLDPERLALLTRRVGNGWSVSLPGLAGNSNDLIKVLAALLRDTPDYLAGVRPLAPEDGRLDGIYTTTLKDGVLRYDAKQATIK